MVRFMRFIKTNKILVAILLLGLFLRVYGARSMFMYGHDQDLQGWIIKDVVLNKHFRLIGQETSTQGIFIGPLFYYLLIPFYLLTKMDPIGGVVLVTLLGVFGIASFNFVFSRVFNKTTGLVAALVYTVSFYTIFNDREVVPTMPVIIWTVWFYYAINLILKGREKLGFILAGVLAGLIWHLNFGLVLVLPLVPIAFLLSKKKINWHALFWGTTAVFITFLPLVLFETRHGFSQTKAVYLALTTSQKDIISGMEKFNRVLHLASKNATGLLWGPVLRVSYSWAPLLMLGTLLLVIKKKLVSKGQVIIMILWLAGFILYFSFYSKIVSEYYLNGMMVVWIAILAVGVSYLLSKARLKFWGYLALFLFSFINLYRFFATPVNRSGYIERKAVVAEIKRDAKERGFPCVAVSYITNPGYELGYRYFYFLEGMHANRPESGSPVYTIVFPLKPIFPTHKTFGAIGLIYPDYKRYTKEGIEESCKGENSNLTDSMFGYTE